MASKSVKKETVPKSGRSQMTAIEKMVAERRHEQLQKNTRR